MQSERTRLAWRRTTLSSTVVAVLAGKALLGSGGAVGIVVAAGVVFAACWVGFWVIAHRRIRVLEGTRVPGALEHRYAVTVVVCLVVTVACGVWPVLRG
ncbi:DUF202 domain-containing protein [Streptomyces sp. WAC 01420]|uniref:DUF202 domain-containing protein n=1 Tax=Streptomyces sp. WAC 01420 TaxID=2203203 RepID=UPI000B2533DF